MRKPIAALMMALMLIALMGGMGNIFAGPPTMTKPVQIWDADGDTAGVSDNGALVGTIVDADGDFIKIDSQGALDVFVQDQSSDRVNIFFHKHLGAPIVLTSGTSINDKVLNVQAGYTAGIGNLICLKEGPEFYQGTILSNTTTTITLDMPLDYAYSAGAVCTATSKHMNVDGSVTPQVFHIKPSVGTKWHINRLIFLIEGTSAMDAGDFGDQAALVNGIVIRKKDGDYQNILNVKTNGDFALEAGPLGVQYDPKPPAGTTAVRVELKFDDVIIELDGDNGDEMEIITQDDITGVLNFNTKGLGHLVVD